MKQKSTTRNALFTSIISLLLCVSMLVGTTFAWFTDSVSSGLNQIVAGNLDVVLEYKSNWEDEWKEVTSDTKIFKEGALYEPGYTEVVFLRIRNAGSLALNYNLYVEAKNEKESTNVYGDTFKLSDHLWVGTYLQDEYSENFNYADILLPTMFGDRENSLGNVDNLSKLSEADSLVASRRPLLPGETTSQVMAIVLTMPEIVGNEANHKTDVAAPQLDLGVKLVAIQYNHENDSFGNDYDEGLNPEYTYVSDDAELKDAMLVRGAKIKLQNDIIVDADTPLQWGSYMFVANGREVTIDLNGKSIIVEEDAFKRANAVFTTANKGTLNIVGEGTVEVKNGQSGIFHAMNNGDQINVYGGTFISNSDDGNNALAIIYTNSGNVDVYGGEFCALAGVNHANAEDKQGNRLSTVFHEGALVNHAKYQSGDASRIQLEENCYLKQVEIDGETWYQVTKKQENTDYISSYDKFLGGSWNYVLVDDLTAPDKIYFGGDTTNTIDLNGKNVTAEGGYLFATQGENCVLTVNGDGVVTTNGGYAGFASSKGILNINGGTYQLGATNNKGHLYAQNSGTIVINGGEFISSDADTPIAYCINGFIEINGGFFQNTANPSQALLGMGNNLSYINNQKITLRGGTFVNWNPMDSAFARPWTNPVVPALIVLADGYQMTSETQANGDIWYTVVPVA